MRKETQVPGSISENELNRLVDAYSGMLLGLCRLTLGDLAMAQDIVQETFLRAWQKGGFRPETEKAWLIRVAMNLCHDYHRSRWWKHIDHRTSTDEIQVTEPDPEDWVILSLVKELPFRERQIVILYYWDRMTMDDIAETLGISQASVYRGLEKAKKLLKVELEGG
ncbi:MAG: sigma-70 family RNA polymerase sigma factor [Clostridia bacterium]|nr:sigma-70 family RNA polymerase sigma factor [Clostridia bacterium]